MTKYTVLQEFTAANGAVYKKGTVLDDEEHRIPEDEVTGYLDAGWLQEQADDAAVEGDEIPLPPNYTKPVEPEGGGTAA